MSRTWRAGAPRSRAARTAVTTAPLRWTRDHRGRPAPTSTMPDSPVDVGVRHQERGGEAEDVGPRGVDDQAGLEGLTAGGYGHRFREDRGQQQARAADMVHSGERPEGRPQTGPRPRARAGTSSASMTASVARAADMASG